METLTVQRCGWEANEGSETLENRAQEIISLARKYYRTFFLRAAHCASYFGHSLEPYALQNKFLALIEPIPPKGVKEHPVVTLHLPGNCRHRCSVYRVKTNDEDDIYVAYVGDLYNELANARRFFSSRCLKSSETLGLVKAGETMQLKKPIENTHIELDFCDVLHEFVNVVLDRETGKFHDIQVEFHEAFSPEPTFEEVATLWIAVGIWCCRVIGVRTVRITGRISALIKNE